MIPVHPISPKLILSIDDDPVILSYEKALLERSGYAVMTASSAQQGLGLVTVNEFDAVLIDYKMPDMNGCDAGSEIKRLRPEQVVILLSGDEVPSYTQAVADAFLHKLEVARELLPTIAKLCNRDHKPQRKQPKPCR